jgi:hypothetical protein
MLHGYNVSPIRNVHVGPIAGRKGVFFFSTGNFSLVNGNLHPI